MENYTQFFNSLPKPKHMRVVLYDLFVRGKKRITLPRFYEPQSILLSYRWIRSKPDTSWCLRIVFTNARILLSEHIFSTIAFHKSKKGADFRPFKIFVYLVFYETTNRSSHNSERKAFVREFLFLQCSLRYKWVVTRNYYMNV